MSLFENASLIVTPNGRKAGKIYALKPFNGSGDLTVVRATTATYVGSDGLIKTALANEVRFDYTNGSCPSILVEPQRTNLFTYSEDFTNASWAKQNSTINSNSIVSPDGNTTADLLLDTTVNTQHRIDKIISSTDGVIYTLSSFFKAKEYDKIALRTADGGLANFNILNGTIISADAGVTAKIENYGNGWFRCSASQIKTAAGTMFSRINILSEGGLLTFAGTGTSGLYIWGAQLEAGSYATSYIPTTSASVTRNADVISKTGISDLIGQTEGTLFCDVNYEAESIAKNYLNLGTSTLNYIAIGARTNNKIGMEVLNSGVQVNASSTSTYSTNQRLKIAMTYKLNDFKLYVNGVLQATDTSGTVPAKAEVYLGSYGNATQQATDGINSAALWKTALTDEQCIALTTL